MPSAALHQTLSLRLAPGGVTREWHPNQTNSYISTAQSPLSLCKLLMSFSRIPDIHTPSDTPGQVHMDMFLLAGQQDRLVQPVQVYVHALGQRVGVGWPEECGQGGGEVRL